MSPVILMMLLIIPLATATNVSDPIIPTIRTTSIGVTENIIEQTDRNEQQAKYNKIGKYEKIQEYIEKNRRQQLNQPTREQDSMNEYVKTYKRFHEKQQNNEELTSDIISFLNRNITKRSVNDTLEIFKFELGDAKTPNKETAKLIKEASERLAKQFEQPIKNIRKRSVPEMVKFELSDAKISNIETDIFIREARERHAKLLEQPANRIKTKRSHPMDMIINEARMIKINHPGDISNRVRVPTMNRQLPVGVQKVINRLVSNTDSMRYGKRIPISGNDWWKTSKLNRPKRLHSAPLVLNPQLLTEDSYFPQQENSKPIEYSEPDTTSYLPKFKYVYKTEPSFEYKFEPNNNDFQLDPIPAIKQNDLSSSPYEATDLTDISALSSLIGKSPTVQLNGLNDLLNNYNEPQKNTTVLRPQELTTPHLFPIDARFATKKPNRTKISFTTVVRHPKPNAKPFYTIGNKSNYLKGSKEVTEYTPIRESEQEGVGIQPVVHVTPPTLYGGKQHIGTFVGQPITYKRQAQDEQDLQYASGYAFGYRVRDFHTGNDFGHTQNRDTDGVTRGEYHILLPDGRIQNVRYTADDKGFHADVSYDNVH